MAKVRITKCSKSTWWYAKKIGEVFVTDGDKPERYGWRVDDCRDGTDDTGYIEPEDCEVVTETERSEGVTVLTDEYGLQREYREVKRNAAVGDFLLFNGASAGITANKPYLVVDFDHDGGEFKDDDGDTRWQAHISAVSGCAVLEQTDTVIIDGKRYKTAERKANVGERVVIEKSTYDSRFKAGEVYTVLEAHDDGVQVKHPKGTNVRHGGAYFCGEYRVLEPLDSAIQPHSDAPDVLALIANISTRLSAAERALAELTAEKTERGASGPVTDKLPSFATHSTKQERLQTKPLDRDDVIALAKEDVETLKKTVYGGGWSTSGIPEHERCGPLVYEFVVNRNKRTVVALGRLKNVQDGAVYNRGKSKCAPDDVFNTHIGRAIALRRALGLDVPTYYTDAPKPTEAQVGDIVRWNDATNARFKITKINAERYAFYSFQSRREISEIPYPTGVEKYCSIIDDSREYTEVSAR